MLPVSGSLTSCKQRTGLSLQHTKQCSPNVLCATTIFFFGFVKDSGSVYICLE